MEKQAAVNKQIKDKRLVTALTRLKEIGNELNDQCWSNDFVNNEVLDRFVEKLRDQIRIENEKLTGVIVQKRSKSKGKNAIPSKD